MMKTNKELLLLRHGKSDWNTDTNDFNRPLNKRGIKNAQQMGDWIEEQKLIPDLIISSPATRAFTTAKIVCETIGIETNTIQTDKNIYEASVSDLHQLLLTIPDSTQRLLLIGHNPGLEYLVRQLAPNIPAASNGNFMPTAAIAYLQLDSHWSSLQGNCFIQRPKDLL